MMCMLIVCVRAYDSYAVAFLLLTVFFYYIISVFVRFDKNKRKFYTAELRRILTWNYFEKVANGLVVIGRQLIDLTALKWNTTLQEEGEEGSQETETDRQA